MTSTPSEAEGKREGINLAMSYLGSSKTPATVGSATTPPISSAVTIVHDAGPTGQMIAGAPGHHHRPRHCGSGLRADNMYDRIAHARDSTSSVLQFGCSVTAIVCESIIGLAFLLLMVALPISMIAIGSAHVNNCPSIPELPVILIVCGSILAFAMLCNVAYHLIEIYYNCRSDKLSQTRMRRAIQVLNVVFVGLLLVSFVLGIMFVYGRYPQPSYPTENNKLYCHPAVFQFSFWLLNIFSVVFGLVAIVSFIGILVDISKRGTQSP